MAVDERMRTKEGAQLLIGLLRGPTKGREYARPIRVVRRIGKGGVMIDVQPSSRILEHETRSDRIDMASHVGVGYGGAGPSTIGAIELHCWLFGQDGQNRFGLVDWRQARQHDAHYRRDENHNKRDPCPVPT